MDMLIDPPEAGAPLEVWDAFIADLKTIKPRTPQLEWTIAEAERDRALSIELHEIRRFLDEVESDPHWGPLVLEARKQAFKDHDWTRYDALLAEYKASRA